MIEVPIKPTGKETSTQRVHNGLVHDQELKVLLWMCERTPEWVTPDLLTLLALLSSFVCAGSYFVSSSRPEFLHLANFCIVLHWLGDSMDGQLARFRNKPRPNYGLFVDMMCDMFAIASICIGMGNSVMNIFVALAMLCSFYLLTVVHLFILKFRNDHKVSAGKFSGTEARMILIMANLLWYFRPSYELYLALNVVAITIFLFLSFMVVVSAVDLGMELKEKDEAALAARLQMAKH